MQDFRSKKEKKKYIEKLLFRFIDAIASKKKIVHDSGHRAGVN